MWQFQQRIGDVDDLLLMEGVNVDVELSGGSGFLQKVDSG